MDRGTATHLGDRTLPQDGSGEAWYSECLIPKEMEEGTEHKVNSEVRASDG